MVPPSLGWVYSYKIWAVSAHRMRMAPMTHSGRPMVSIVFPWLVTPPVFQFPSSSEIKGSVSEHNQLVSAEDPSTPLPAVEIVGKYCSRSFTILTSAWPQTRDLPVSCVCAPEAEAYALLWSSCHLGGLWYHKVTSSSWLMSNALAPPEPTSLIQVKLSKENHQHSLLCVC